MREALFIEIWVFYCGREALFREIWVFYCGRGPFHHLAELLVVAKMISASPGIAPASRGYQ